MTDTSMIPNTVDLLNRARTDRVAAQAVANVSMAGTVGIAPAQAAVNVNTSDLLGLTPDYVGRNREMIDRQAMLERVRSTPALANWHADDPANAAISLDKIPFLQTAAEKIGNIGKLAYSGFLGAGEGIAGTLEVTSGVIDQAMTEAGLPPSYWKNISEFYGAERRRGQAMREDVKSSMHDVGNFESAVYSGIESLVQTAPGMVASVITRNPMYALGMSGTMVGGQSAGQALDKGLSPAHAFVYGAEDAAVEVITESIPVISLLKDLKVGSSFGRMVMHQIIKEVPGELAATTLQDFNAYANLTPDAPISDYVNKLPADLASTVIATVSSVGVQTGIAKAAQSLAERTYLLEQNRFRADAASTLVKDMHDLMQSPDGKEMIARSPERVRQLFRSADDNKTFHIAAEPMLELFQTLPEPARKTLLDALPGFDGQLQEAAAADTDIIMRRGDYAALFASQPWSAPLVEHVRESQNDVSKAELEALMKDHELQSEMEQAEQMGRLESRLQRRLQDSIQNAGVTPANAAPQAQLLDQVIGRADRVRALAGQTGDIAARLERALTFRRSAAEYVQPERIDELTQHLTNIKARMATEKAPARVTRRSFPVLDYIVKQSGGIDPSGSFGRVLASEDVTPKSHPWVFKKGGAGEIDALDTTSLKGAFPALNLPTSELGKYSVNDLHEIIRQELKAPAQNKEQTSRQAAEDNLMSLLDEGLGLSMKEIEALTPERLKELLAEYEKGNGTGETLNQAANADVDQNRVVDVVDLSDVVDHKITNAELKAKLRELAKSYDALPTADSDRLMRVLPRNVNHIVYSSLPKELHNLAGKRKRSILDIEKIIGGSVLIESIPNRKREKSGVVSYHRFYTPVKIGNRFEVIRIVAEQTKSGLSISPNEFELYDVIPENRRPPANATQSAVKQIPAINSKGGDTVTIAEMLAGVKDADGKPYFETLFQQSRGSISFDAALERVVIALSSKANLSTLLHEFGHYAGLLHRQTAQIARDALAAGTVTDPSARAELEQVIKDWETLKENLGATSEELTVDQEEQIAQWFEQYLREGDSPKAELRDIFATFKSWLMEIYKTVRDLGKPINADVRQVFDRWIASDDEIKAAQEVNLKIEQIAAQFDMLDSAGLSKEQADARATVGAKVARLLNKAGNRAGEALLAEVLKEESKKQTEEYKADYERTLAEVTKDADERRVYAAQDHIRAGHRMDAKLVEQVVGKDIAKRLPNGLRGGTAHPDMIAMQFGFIDGAEMIREIVSNLPKKDYIAQETDRLMLERHGNMLEDGRAAARAKVLVANDEVGQAIELLVKTAGEKQQTRRLVKAAARQRMMDTRYTDINPGRYERARDVALRAAYSAGVKGQGGGSATHLWKAMLNHELLMAANEMREEQAKQLEAWKKLTARPSAKGDEKLAKAYDLDLLDVARALLGRSGLGTGIQGYDVAAKLIEHGDDELDRLVAATHQAGKPAKNYKDMTGREFREFAEAINNIRKVSRDRRTMILDGQRVAVEDIRSDMRNEFLDLIKPDNTPMNTREAQQSKWLRAKGWLLNTNSWLMRVEHWVRSIEGDNITGPLHRVFRSIKTACNSYQDSLTFTTKEMVAILKPLDGTLDRNSIDAPELGQRQKIMGRQELLGILLHMGNTSNTDKLVGGYASAGWTHDGLQKFMQRMIAEGKITRQDIDVVQKIWDLLESLKPQAQAAHYQRYGYRFDEVTATPFSLKFGDEDVNFRGGYFPAIASPTLVTDAAMREKIESVLDSSQAVMWPTTSKGFTKSRVESYQAPLQLDASLAVSHVSKVLKFIHLENPVLQAARVFKDRSLQEVIGQTNPHIVSETIIPWLQRVARQGVNSTRDSTGIGKFVNAQRRYAGVSSMALNVVNTIQQYFDLATVAQEVGAANLSRATSRYLSNPRASVKWVTDMSGEMRNRLIVFQDEMPSAVMQILRNDSKAVRVRDAAIHHGYILQRMVQTQIDTVTFIAAYDKAIADGMNDADAVYYAERAIRLTQSSSRPEDVSKIEAFDNPFMRLFIMFYGWFNNKYNQQVYGVSRLLRENGWKDASPKIAYLMLMTTMIPYVLGQAVYDGFTGGLPDDDDDDGVVDDWFFWVMSATFRGVGAEIPGVRELTNLIVNEYGNKPYNSGLISSPVVNLYERAVRAPKDAYQLATGEKDQSAAFKDFMALITVTTGVPTGQLGKTGGYLLDINEGDVNPDGVGDVTRGLLAGTPRK